MLPRIRSGLLALVISTFVGFTLAATVTVDDADSGITYSSGWNVGNTCAECLAQPDKPSTHGGTWHDSTRGENSTENFFEYSFQGTSLNIYGILVNIVIREYLFTTNVDLTITLDGQSSTYVHAPADTNSYAYQSLVFSKSGLSNTAHAVRVTLNPSSAFLFDYLEYTTADATSTTAGTSTTSSSQTSGTSSGLTTTASTISSGSSRTSSSPSSSLSAVGSVSISTDSSGAIHTVDTSVSAANAASSSAPPLSMILGIVGGIVGLLLLAILLLIFLLCRKRRNSQNMGPLPSTTTSEHVSDPLMLAGGPSAYPHTFGHSTNEFSQANLNGGTPFASSHNLTSPGGASDSALASAVAATMNSKQRRMQQEQAFLPAQHLSPHRLDAPAWVTGGGGGGGGGDDRTAYSEGSGIQQSVYGGMDGVSSHTGPMTATSGSTDYNYDTSSSSPMSRRPGAGGMGVAPGVGGRAAPWNTGLYAHGVPAPVSLVAPMPVPLGVPLGHGQSDDDGSRSRSAASGVTRPPTAPPPYIRSPPPLNAPMGGEHDLHRRLGSVSEYGDEKR